MRSITVAVIFAGLVTYNGGYTPPATPSDTPTYASFSIDSPPFSNDPDDEEEDRIMRRKKETTK